MKSILNYTLIWTEKRLQHNPKSQPTHIRIQKKQKSCIGLRVTFVRNVGDTPVKGEPNTPVWKNGCRCFHQTEP